jgi:hypothetical protein
MKELQLLYDHHLLLVDGIIVMLIEKNYLTNKYY